MNNKMWAVVGALTVAGAALIAVQAQAGRKTPVIPVSIDTGARTFQGALGASRNSSNGTEWINCYVNSNGTGGCTAVNSTGTTVVTTTTSSTIRNIIQTVNGDSFVSVAYDSSSVITSIIVGNGSHHQPKLL